MSELPVEHGTPEKRPQLAAVPKREAPGPRQKKRLWVGALIIVALASLSTYTYNLFFYETTDDAYVQAHTTFLAPQVGGIVVQVLVDENWPVKKGQLLAQIDDRDYRARVDEARANLLASKALLVQASADFTRNRTLYRSRAISRAAFDKYQASYDQLRNNVLANQAALDLAQVNLEYTRVVAPSDGTISKKSVEPGMVAAPGSSLFAFVETRDRWVIANFEEGQIRRILPGKKARIVLDANKRKVYDGYVESLDPASGSIFTLLPPDNATGNFTKTTQRVPIKIRFDHLSDQDVRELHAGLSAVATVLIRSEGATPDIRVYRK